MHRPFWKFNELSMQFLLALSWRRFLQKLSSKSFWLFVSAEYQIRSENLEKKIRNWDASLRRAASSSISLMFEDKLHNKMQLLLSFSMGKSYFFKNIDNLFALLECFQKFYSIYSPFDNVVALSHELWREIEEFTVREWEITTICRISSCFKFQFVPF